MHIATGDADEWGNVAVQVEQSMHLDGGLAPAKIRPRKQRQAQVDGGRIQSVQALLQIDANRVICSGRAMLINTWAKSAKILQS